MCEIVSVPNGMCVHVCVCVNKWVCVRAHVQGTQRAHCDMVLSLKALESGVLSRSETQTIYNSQLVLILQKFPFPAVVLFFIFFRGRGMTLEKLLEKEKPHYGLSVSWKSSCLGGQCQPQRCSFSPETELPR